MVSLCCEWCSLTWRMATQLRYRHTRLEADSSKFGDVDIVEQQSWQTVFLWLAVPWTGSICILHCKPTESKHSNVAARWPFATAT